MTTPTTVQVKLQIRADTAANWTAVNPVLLANEIALESDTKKIKINTTGSSQFWDTLSYFPFVVSGGTVLDSLTIGSTGTLSFEGSTDDGFETTLAVADPTADRTITLPDQSGTVIVSGNASIVNADIAANAEIAVSKLANGTANQVIVTDGTNVSWSDNLTLAGDLTVNGTTTTINTETLTVKDKNIELAVVDTPTDVTADGGGITLKGTTDKTINWVDATDAWTSSERFSVPLGSASVPSLTFTGDPNTGIYSPGADQLALSTNGTGRLFVDASGNVGVGRTPVAYGSFKVLDLAGPSGAIQKWVNTATTVELQAYASATLASIGSATNHPFIINTNDQERLRITSAGLVGIGTSSPGYNLHVKGSAAGEIAVDSASGSDSILRFLENGTSEWSIYHPSGTGDLRFYESGSAARVTFKAGGNVGIGTTSPDTKLDINGALFLRPTSETFPAENGAGLRLRSDTNHLQILALQYTPSVVYYDIDYQGLKHYWYVNGSEKMQLDGSGRLLVGTSSDSQVSTVVFQGSTSGAANNSVLRLCRGESSPADGAALGFIAFGDSGHTTAASVQAARDGGTWTSGTSQPTRLVFSTTADAASSPTERMRITNGGLVDIGGLYSVGANAIRFDVQGSNFSRNTTSSATQIAFANPNGTVGTITTSGSATAYNTSSDYRLKENVTQVTDGITRLQQLKPSRFNFIADPDNTVDGFLAHEVQTIVPEAITGEKDAVDDEGNPVYQGIDQSKLVPLLTAALQEAVAKIETLEAKVAALESA